MNKRQTLSLRLSVIILVSTILLSSCILVAEETSQTPTGTPTPADVIIPLTATSAVSEVVETVTTEPTDAEPLDTQEPASTFTPITTGTFTTEPTGVPTDTPAPSPTPFPYGIQTGTPVTITNYAHPEGGCNWLGVAGQIFDEAGNPLLNQVVLVNGQYDGSRVELVGVTGTVEGDVYGPGGYEIVIGDNLIATQGQLFIQVFDLSGIPISDMFAFDTFVDCEKNLIIINFIHHE